MANFERRRHRTALGARRSTLVLPLRSASLGGRRGVGVRPPPDRKAAAAVRKRRQATLPMGPGRVWDLSLDGLRFLMVRREVASRGPSPGWCSSRTGPGTWSACSRRVTPGSEVPSSPAPLIRSQVRRQDHARHSPKPIDAAPGRRHAPRRITSSPSSRNPRVSPLGNTTGSVPRHDNSSSDPRSSCVGPDTVPLASRSPGRRLQPVRVWCATIWSNVQYICLNSLRLRRTAGSPRARMRWVCSDTSRRRSIAPRSA